LQVFIARLLNKLLIFMLLAVGVLGAGLVYVAKNHRPFLYPCAAAFLALTLVLTLVFKWLENSLDKTVVMKMVRSGKIALVNIESAGRFLPLRDTGFTSYWIFEFEGTLYDGEHNPLKKTFYEKMNRNLENVPPGSVYVTYDPAKPAQIFIIPNALLGSLPALRPVVEAYEKDRNIAVKYLDVHYNKGMVVRSFQEAMNEFKREKEKHEDRNSR
jgi:hypothetical protein